MADPITLDSNSVKNNENPTGIAKVLRKSFSLLNKLNLSKVSAEDIESRKQLTKIGNQGILTVEILQDNHTQLVELAQENEQVSELLKTLDSGALSGLNNVQEKLTSNQNLSTKDTKFLISTLEQITGTLNSVGIKLDVDLKAIISGTGKLLENDSISLDDRRSILKQTINQLKESRTTNELSKKQIDAINTLETLNVDQVNIQGKQRTEIQQVLNDIRDDSTEIKISASLKELNNNLDSFVLTQDELKGTLEKETETGESLKDKLLSSGLGGTVGGGLLSFALSAAGLGGLDQILPVAGALTGGAGLLKKGGAKAAQGGSKLLSALGIGGGLLGAPGLIPEGTTVTKGAKAISKVSPLARGAKLLKGGGKLLGKVALPIAAVLSVMDFAQGFADAAEIAGLQPGTEADFGTKVQAGVSSVLSGLTFGFVDSKEIFDNLGNALDFVFDEKGLLATTGIFLVGIKDKLSAVSSLALEKVKGGFNSLFGEEGFLSKTGTFLSKIVGLTPFALIVSNLENIESAISGLFGEDGVLSKASNLLSGVKSRVSGFFGLSDEPANVKPSTLQTNVSSPSGGLSTFDVEPVSIEVKPTTLEDKGVELLREKEQSRLSLEEVVKSLRQPQIVPVSTEKAKGRVIDRNPNVDDLGLGLINSPLFGN